MIYIDSREPKSVMEAFDNANILYEVKTLQYGDFTNDKQTFVVERKSKNDQWNSMVDKRLYEQIAGLYKEYKENRYLFVEVGVFVDLWSEKGDQYRNWIYSVYGEAEKWGVKLKTYFDLEDLALKMDSLDKKLGGGKIAREKSIKIYGVSDATKMLMQSPGIGKKLAKKMLKVCNTFYGVMIDLLGDQKKLDKVKGVCAGGKLLENLKETIEEGHA